MNIAVNDADLALLFPSYVRVDAGLRVVSCGPALSRLVPAAVAGARFGEVFKEEWACDSARVHAMAAARKAIRLSSRSCRRMFIGSVIPDGDGALFAINPTPMSIGCDDPVLQLSDFEPGSPIVPAIILLGMQQALIDEAAEAALELVKERQKSLGLLERLSRLAGIFAHDFNNLLSVMALNAKCLQRDAALQGQSRRQIDILGEALDRGADLTQSLMVIAQQRHDSRLPTSIDRLLAENLDIFKSTAGRGIALSLDLRDEGAVVEVSKTGLVASLVNLIVNSREVTTGCGTIRISTRLKDAGAAPPAPGVRCGEGRYIVIEVIDNGPGISEEAAARAVETFRSPSRLAGGLGLPSVHDFALEMEGFIAIGAGRGGGAAVAIWLPVASPSPATGETAPGDESRALRPARARILVVEDEPLALEALGELLEGLGHDVELASGANSARAILAQRPCDILLTDIVMPDGSGIDLANWASGVRAGIGVVLMSGFVPDASGLRGEWQFLRKPFRQDLLREMINKALDARSGPA